MDDREHLLYAYQGDTDAVDMVLSIAETSHIWDDLIDRDKPVSDTQINRAFFIALLELPRNPFYIKHRIELLPVMTTSAVNWLTANEYEKGADEEAHALAHVLRYSIADLVLLVAFIIGGRDWVQKVAPELRRLSQKDSLQAYLSEVRSKHV
jgi:hypothetical protein